MSVCLGRGIEFRFVKKCLLLIPITAPIQTNLSVRFPGENLEVFKTQLCLIVLSLLEKMVFSAVGWVTPSRAGPASERPERVNPERPILERAEGRSPLPCRGEHRPKENPKRDFSPQDARKKGRPSPRPHPRELRAVFSRIPRPSTDLWKRTRCTESRSSRFRAAGLGMLDLPT